MALKVNSINTIEVGAATSVIRMNAITKCLIANSLSDFQRKQLLNASFMNEDNTFNKGIGINEHLESSDKLFYSLVGSTRKTREMSCVDMPIEKFSVTKSSDVNFKPVCEIASCVKDNTNVVEIFYFDRKKEFWLIVLDNQYDTYKKIIKSCRDFEELYPEFEYLVLRKEQIDFDEIPETNVELKRDVDE